MVNYTYSKLPTINFNTTPASIARSATGSVYAVGDTTYTTPLNMTLVVGGSVVTSISSDANGLLPDFTLLDRTSCVWKQTGVSFATVLTTSDPVPGPQGAAGSTGATGAQGVPGDVSTWKPTTFYPLNTPVTNPSGDLVKVTTAHTSTGSYDAAKFSTPYDAAVQSLVNTPGSATQVALAATYLPRTVNPALPTDVTTLLRLDPNEAGVAPFDIVSKQFANGGGKPYNVGTWIGYNARTYLQDGSGEVGKLTWNLGMESGYRNPDDLTYGPEFYLNYGTPDNTTIQIAQLRPMYFRLIGGDTNAVLDKGVHILFDIGQSADGVFSVNPGYITGKGLLYVTKAETRLTSTAVVVDGGSLAVRPLGTGNITALSIIDSKGAGAAVQAFRVGGAPAGGFLATTVDTLYLSDKADNPVLVSNYGATVATRQINVRGAFKVDGVIKAGSDATMAVTVADTGNLGAVPTVTGNAVRGTVNIGTGAAPAAGDAVSITLPAGAYATAPTVVVSGANFNTGGRGVYAYAVSATEIRIGFASALAASQAAGTYKVNYQIIG